MDKYSIYNPDWARGLIRAVKTLNNLYGEKEVKKVRPYLEVKIVKVKKPRIKPKVKKLILRRREHDKVKEEYISVKINDPKLYLYRHEKSKVGDEAIYPDRKIWKIIKIIEPKKPEGNWVNGENIDKIKFPCVGWYLSVAGKRYCELDFINYKKGFYRVKELKQYKEKDYHCAEFWNPDLRLLIESLDFHILKGKIILWEVK